MQVGGRLQNIYIRVSVDAWGDALTSNQFVSFVTRQVIYLFDLLQVHFILSFVSI